MKKRVMEKIKTNVGASIARSNIEEITESPLSQRGHVSEADWGFLKSNKRNNPNSVNHHNNSNVNISDGNNSSAI